MAQDVEWISHRGYKQNAVENTRSAFQAAVGLGFKTLETDLHATADDHIVLAHDPNFSRLAGDSRPIAQLSKADLLKLYFKDGSQPYFFDDFTAEFSAQSWVFDIKPETAEKTLALLRKLNASKSQRQALIAKTRFVVWSRQHATSLQRALPGARCFARELECYRAGIAVLLRLSFCGGIKKDRIYSLTQRLGPCELFKKSIIEAYHHYGAQILAFLPEGDLATQQALSCGCDLILTNGRIQKI